MNKHPLAEFAKKKPTRTAEFLYGGVTHKLRGRPFGDAFFEVLYPDAEEAFGVCAHQASVNGRNDPTTGKPVAYPVSLYGDVLAILATYDTPAGTEELDPSLVFTLYDNDPALFGQLRAHALMALGVLDTANPNSGKTAWQGMLLAIKELEKLIKAGEADDRAKELVKGIRQATKTALRDFGQFEEGDDSEDDPRDVSPLMEGAQGNSPAAP